MTGDETAEREKRMIGSMSDAVAKLERSRQELSRWCETAGEIQEQFRKDMRDRFNKVDDRLDAHAKKLDDLTAQINKDRIDIAKLDVRSGLIATLVSILVGAASIFIKGGK